MAATKSLSGQRRSEARARGELVYLPGKPCKHGHHTWRYVSNTRCLGCAPMYNASAPEVPKEKAREYRSRYIAKNAEKITASAKAWRLANRDYEQYASQRRRAMQKNAIPKWANELAIRALYRKARDLSNSDGIPRHVDHIVPIISNYVCGLHCEQNLQIIHAMDNMKKSNFFWPDMPSSPD